MLGRIFKFYLSNEYLLPNTKQSQGSVLVKLFPKEKIVSCCKSNLENILYLVSYKGKFFKLKIDKVHNANDAKLGYLNENFNLGDDHFIKIFTDDYLLDIETSKNKSARLNLNKLIYNSKKNIFEVNFLNLDKDEYLTNCFCIKNSLT